MDYSMERAIEDIKTYCLEQKLSEYGSVVAAARGTFDSAKRFEPDRSYSIAEVCDLLEALHDIVYADMKQKEMP